MDQQVLLNDFLELKELKIISNRTTIYRSKRNETLSYHVKDDFGNEWNLTESHQIYPETRSSLEVSSHDLILGSGEGPGVKKYHRL